MKALLLFIVIMSVAGCDASTEPRHIAYAQDQCASNGGLRSFHVHWLGEFMEIQCNNGAFFKAYVKVKP